MNEKLKAQIVLCGTTQIALAKEMGCNAKVLHRKINQFQGYHLSEANKKWLAERLGMKESDIK